ncbi:MAG: ImmA/IrrE family metallo-endopeptidase [Magnetococcales bacterium]|nr:ImmA/IrrE family metallo-endopeptidase [Magnetococcales bacterium]
MNAVLVKPTMLRWARERAALSEEQLANKLNVPTSRLLAWEGGLKSPTFKQAEKIAQKTHVPFGCLFLPEPPPEVLPIPDLRTWEGIPLEQPSADFFDLIRNVMFQQDWYREYRLEYGADPLPFVGKFRLGADVQTVAEDIRRTLNMDHLLSAPNWEKHLGLLCDRCEEVGIWIMRAGYIGSNTHRTLRVEEFRGFAISDPLVPLIFINGKDAKAAQIFTLAHELAHLWFGESGISNLRFDEAASGKHVRIERVCNRVAAELLVPRARFLAAWNSENSPNDNVLALTGAFKVSGVVIARRALDLGKIDNLTYRTFCQQELKSWQKKQEKKTDGGNYYATLPIANGRKFTDAVLISAMSGKLLLRDAGGLLHMNPRTIQELFRQKHKE